MHERLIIGICGLSARTKSVRAIMRQIQEEGATPVYLTNHALNLKRAVQNDISRINALVLMGNDRDIDPGFYLHRYGEGESKRCIHPQTKSELCTPRGKARARYETIMLTKALARGMPVLGICGGMQRINVHCGGTLHQHVPDLVGCDKHMQSKKGIALHIPVVPVVIKEHTLLSDIAGSIRMPFTSSHSKGAPKVIMENSLHHQAVDKVAPCLRVCAVTDSVRLKDGTQGYLAEAVETDPEGPYGKQFILGVQWHPEFGASSLGQKIIQRMLFAARQFARPSMSSRLRRKIVFRSVKSIQTNK